MIKEVDILNRLSQARVLCLGDVMLDTFIFGDVERISPEAPVPVLHIREEQCVLGGAGNVVRNLVGLGARAYFIGCIGEDIAGSKVTYLLKELPGVTAELMIEKGRQTTHKTRYVAHQQLLRADRETVQPLAWTPEFQSQLEQFLPQSDIVVLSDYAKGFFTRETCQNIIQLARAYHLPIVVDPKGTDWSRYHGATLLTPNKKELQHMVHGALGTVDEIQDHARVLARSLDVEGILVTLGAEGMVYAGGTEKNVVAKALAKEVYDVSGAGDTVISVLAAALACGAEIEEAVHLANIAAGVVVGKIGTAPIYLEDLHAVLHSETSGAKVVSRAQLVDHVQKLRRQKKRIGFTNGCFDLLHKGHLTILAEAKAQCDVLVVGVNSDASVQRLKGKTRPIQSQDTRLEVLAALQMVDFVVLFEEDTPLALIQAAQPDVLIKGADYTVEQVVGADVVLNRGGLVHLVPLIDGHSTTGTVKKITADT